MEFAAAPLRSASARDVSHCHLYRAPPLRARPCRTSPAASSQTPGRSRCSGRGHPPSAGAGEPPRWCGLLLPGLAACSLEVAMPRNEKRIALWLQHAMVPGFQRGDVLQRRIRLATGQVDPRRRFGSHVQWQVMGTPRSGCVPLPAALSRRFLAAATSFCRFSKRHRLGGGLCITPGWQGGEARLNLATGLLPSGGLQLPPPPCRLPAPGAEGDHTRRGNAQRRPASLQGAKSSPRSVASAVLQVGQLATSDTKHAFCHGTSPAASLSTSNLQGLLHCPRPALLKPPSH